MLNLDIFKDKVASNIRLRALLKDIESGNINKLTSSEYAHVLSSVLGKELGEHILGLKSDERERVFRGLLEYCYRDINSVCAAAQEKLDAEKGFSIEPQKAPLPVERIRKAAHSLIDPTVSDDVICRRAKSTSENITFSFHDDYVKKNAEFRNDAGIKCYLTRTTDGSCCKWCTSLAGRYDYAAAPNDVFRRHDNCSCSLVFENGRQRQDVWTKRTWEVSPEDVPEFSPTVFTREQANSLEQQRLTEYMGLTNADEGDKIITGALNPYSKKAGEHADQYYESVRKMTTDVKRIAENTGFTEDDILSIKKYLFLDEHDLGNKTARFDPDYKIAQTWQRLIDGKNIQPHDLTLIKHEKMERELMRQGLSQDKAHIETTKTFNYDKEAKEYHDKIEKHKKE